MTQLMKFQGLALKHYALCLGKEAATEGVMCVCVRVCVCVC